MPEKPLPINEVVAQNLAQAMRQVGMSQAALAKSAGVSQKTISNYLNPSQRAEGSSGKPPSPKLVELEAIGRVLGMQVWQLTRQMNERERALYASIEKAYLDLTTSAQEITTVAASGDASQAAPAHQEYPRSRGGNSALERAAIPDVEDEDGAVSTDRRGTRQKGPRGS